MRGERTLPEREGGDGTFCGDFAPNSGAKSLLAEQTIEI